jgi:alpha-galactosidase
MAAKKIACLGGGSLYFLRAVPDLLLSPELAGSEIVLYDLDAEKARRMAAMGARMARAAAVGFRVRAADELADAVDGADFALSSIGGSGAEVGDNVYASATHAADISIPARYGIPQIVGDTCGPAGMMMGLRSVPAYLAICREMERRCPGVVLLNHSNPMAVLCRAMRKYTSINVVGICHGVQIGICHAARLLEVPAEELECLWVGTNHYYWFTQVRRRGVDVYPELMRRVRHNPPGPGETMSALLSRAYGYQIVYPEDDHVVEFTPFLPQCPSGPEALPYALADRAREFNAPAHCAAEPGAPALVRERFFAQYQEMLDRAELPAARDDSVGAEGVGAVLGAMAEGKRRVCIANLANRGAIPNLPDHAEVEVEAVTDSRGVRPIHMGDAPLVLKGLLEKRFVWQELVADAAAKGDRNLALQALLVDEMAIWPDKAEAMLDELLEASRPLLPAFFP